MPIWEWPAGVTQLGSHEAWGQISASQIASWVPTIMRLPGGKNREKSYTINEDWVGWTLKVDVIKVL